MTKMTMCFSCGHEELVEMTEDLVCARCGCCQQVGPILVSSHNTHEHVYVWEDQPNNNLHNNNPLINAFNMVQKQFDLCDSIIESAQKLLYDFVTTSGSVKGKDKAKYALAAVFYASRMTQFPILRKRFDLLASACDTTSESINDACASIKNILGKNSRWKEAFSMKQTREYMNTVLPILKSMGLSQKEIRILLSKTSKAYDRVCNHTDFKSMHPVTSALGLLLVAVKSTKVQNINLTRILSHCTTTGTSILHAERVIVSILRFRSNNNQ